jgi:hypothetical protein
MDPASLAASLAMARQGQLQLAIAAKMMKINAENARSVVGLLDAAQANLQQVTASAAGVGQALDITV